MDTFLKWKKEKNTFDNDYDENNDETNKCGKSVYNRFGFDRNYTEMIFEICVLLNVDRNLDGHGSDESGKFNKQRVVYSK